MDTAEHDILSSLISEVLLARSNLYRSCGIGISTVTWPEVSRKTSAFSFVTLFMGINYQDSLLPEAVSKDYLKICMLYWTELLSK